MAQRSVIVGTAGHIDHGKTALVKALTGIDADRLEEEKRRGITIDLGFAHMEMPAPNGSEKIRLGFVDVPGHERFVRNMLAGVGGIDLVLLVIAADEGIKPQTREHFDICRLLNIGRGITVLTKSDKVDAETLAVTRAEVGEYLRGTFLDPARAPVIAVSAQNGDGLEELKRSLATIAAESPARDADALFRLPIDRVFTMKGHGTVVTGTLVAGSVRKEDEAEVFPSGRRVRVRGVQVHGAQAEKAVAGERTALNLANVGKEELARGMTLAAPGCFRATRRVDVSIQLLKDAKPLKDRARVHLHAYTQDCVAEAVMLGAAKSIAPGASGFAQLRTEIPVLLVPGDRFILRQFSPVVTLGGGVVLDNAPPKRRPDAATTAAFLVTMQSGSDVEKLMARIIRRGAEGLDRSSAVAETGWAPRELNGIVSGLVQNREIADCFGVLVDAAALTAANASALAALNSFHEKHPLVAGMNKEELREKLELRAEVFASVISSLTAGKQLEITGDQARLAGRGVVLKDEESEAKAVIEKAFRTAGLKVPALKEVMTTLPVDKTRATKIVTLLLRDRVLVKLSDDLVFHQEALAELKKMMAEKKAAGAKTMDVGAFKDMTGISRKYAIPLLEFLDRERVTRRDGDKRVLL